MGGICKGGVRDVTVGRSEGGRGGRVSVRNASGDFRKMKLWSQRSQNLFFPSFEYFFWKKLIFWPLLGHFLVQQKFLITPFLAPGQFTTENRAIFGPNQQFFLRQKFDRKGVKNHQNIFGECSLGSKEHLKFWSFWPLTHGYFPKFSVNWDLTSVSRDDYWGYFW